MRNVEPKMAVSDHTAFCTGIGPEPVRNSTIDTNSIKELADNADLRLVAVADVPLDDLPAVCIHSSIDLYSIP